MAALKFKDFNSTDRDESFEQFYKIYSDSIEKSEQKPKQKIRQITEMNNYLLRLQTHSENVSGFTLSYFSNEKKIALLEYMAVDQSQRSRGLGSNLFDDLILTLKAKKMEWLFIEVDSPFQKCADREKRIRRVQFYQKNGCRLIEPFNYILPLPGVSSELEMKIMAISLNENSKPELSFDFFKIVIRDIYQNVYDCDPAFDFRFTKMFSNRISKLTLSKMEDHNV